jgi:hypothetical protein
MRGDAERVGRKKTPEPQAELNAKGVGLIGSTEFFAEGTAHTTAKWDVHHAGLTRYRQGVMGG